jgi:dCMP deaminase
MSDQPTPAAIRPPEGRTTRPDKAHYFLLLALAARTRADCLGRRVGAIITRDGRVISTGYNGTPFGMTNCSEGGCHRCARRAQSPELRGGGYDACLCVHAEQNAILTAARFGQQTLGSAITSTTQPCFICLREMLQAGISEVAYLHPWDPVEAYGDPALAQQYATLRARFDRFEQVGDPATDTPALFAPILSS